MKHRWDYYPDGQRVGGIKVVERLTSGDRPGDVRYEVACMSCGEHSEMSHKYIVARANKNVDGCHSCRVELAARARREKALRQTKVSEPEGAIRAGRHLWWPMLGPMGGRHDSGRWTCMPGGAAQASRAPI
ncbi:MAG: hypothetical protein EOM22_12890 [Gammaproteobacteria bacterium]|nr:hypothetical protein [Gammaproteobacteria bacterium]